MVSVLFSAIVTERRGELGLLKAIGARRSQVIGMMVTEAVLATGVGGLAGRRAGRADAAPVRALAGLLPREGGRALPLGRHAAHGRLCGGGDRAGLHHRRPGRARRRRGGRAGATPTTSCAARVEPMLSCRAVEEELRHRTRRRRGGGGHRPRRRAGPVRSHHRPVGLRQVLADGDDRRPEPAVRAGRSWSRAPTSGACRRMRWRLSATARSAYVFQFASLLPTLRLIDNVALPALLGKRRPATDVYAKASTLLGRMGLRDYLDAYPSEVSAGEQRRAVIARALINDPALRAGRRAHRRPRRADRDRDHGRASGPQPRARHDLDPGDPQSLPWPSRPSRSCTSPTASSSHE